MGGKGSGKGSGTRQLGRMNPRLAPTGDRPTVYDLYWAAGIFEGEGSCNRGYNIDDYGNTYGNGSEHVSVSQNDRWILDKLRSFFGGSVNTYNRASGTEYVWEVCGARARGFLQTIYVLLSPRCQKKVRVCLNI